MNYIANIIKAERSFGKSTSIETFQKKLLRGPVFGEVSGIEKAGLSELYNMIKSGGKQQDVFRPSQSQVESSQLADERDLLISDKRKKERAAARLKALYLYSEETITEKDFIVESKKLADEIKRIDDRLEEIEKNSSGHFSMTDDEFMSKASVFIVTNKLLEKRSVDYEKLLQIVTSQTVKDFVQTVIQRIVIQDGKVTEIQFKNGIVNKFQY